MSSPILLTAEGFPEYPPRTAVPPLCLDASISRESINAGEVVSRWIAALSRAIDKNDVAVFEGLFVQESWWRDLVALTWNITSKNGPSAISAYVLGSVSGFGGITVIKTPSLAPSLQQLGSATFIQAAFAFTTKFGSGRGMVRLANVGPNEWKAWTASTELEHLKEAQEANEDGSRRVNCLENGQKEPMLDELQVLVVGGGQCGVFLAAHLEHMGLSYLLVDKNPRVGDSWRNRYETLKIHTPSSMNSFPFLRFPTSWPRYMTKHQYGEWMECYSRIMNLKIRTNTTVRRVVREDGTRCHRIELETNGTLYTIKAKHVVLSTGLHSDQPVRLDIPGQEAFRGQIYHTCQHKSASEVSNLANKSVTIVGVGPSAHDIAHDFVTSGAGSVSMIQRSPNVFVTPDSLEKFILRLWTTRNVSTEDADLIDTSMPNVLALTLAAGMTPLCAQFDRDLIKGLEEAGMAIRKGEDGISLLDHLLLKSGHLYIDHGAAQMVVDGRIKVHRSSKGLESFYDRGIELADGRKLESDVIVLATGWERNGNVVERLLGKDLANQVNSREWGHLDEESERKGWWRPSGVSGIWCMSGAISSARQFSKVLALQIDAVERGYNDQYYAV
ncbi:Pyridine nucleotide-disulfide oxidoreductase, FAD/NAD(P)-binding domain protein [Metarhizium album ARSEF 1941]|uniref:Pyridine nucleotide-disulfide oxidoreductase, FAD/NAD(P)-binding domain protein n=1 Tax=Metarhizium album (strain ARSEF 1941) TaxID=1081103 RepID=A0A0B2X296_METAS|nr:Pyridine nucleotide-disulfide oxidoreductase, FAD/NAD(P)-binding domain protein [Metarhizium album ARSEF 1941]KHN99847.1 Pyridine nucleotide-disulfide oxidoreductase, FAD/NAD(P)-binding domain protein [Metarhizium album ARSEF 1941]